jgi:hypothetical protein
VNSPLPFLVFKCERVTSYGAFQVKLTISSECSSNGIPRLLKLDETNRGLPLTAKGTMGFVFGFRRS